LDSLSEQVGFLQKEIEIICATATEFLLLRLLYHQVSLSASKGGTVTAAAVLGGTIQVGEFEIWGIEILKIKSRFPVIPSTTRRRRKKKQCC